MKIFEKVLQTLGLSEDEVRQALGGPAALQIRKALPGASSDRMNSVPAQVTFPPPLVYLLLDTSGSMEEGDKLSQARRGGRRFASDAIAKGYAVGVIRFSDEAELAVHPTTQPVQIEMGLTGSSTGGSTNMTAAIDLAVGRLSSRTFDRAIVLVTDGFPDDATSALAAAERGKQEGITIIAIGTDDADRDFLSRIASAKGLSQKVKRQDLHVAIADSARLLPAKKRTK